jgi:hypothetical protein
MKNFFVLIAFSIFFFACEDEIVPIPLPPSQSVDNAQTEEKAEVQAPAEKPSEPAKPIKTPAKEPIKAPAKESAKTIVYSAQSDDIEQLSSGRYVIQVAVFPIEASAKKLIKKLAENGIKAYNAKVQDPDPKKGVIGTYYRVRVGFFDGRTSAETFAKTRLESIGYAWWIDRSKNDNIGSTVAPEPEPFVVERIPEQEPKQMSEQEKKEAERAAAIAAAKEEYKAIAKAATAIPPPKIPAKATPEKESAVKDSRVKVKMKKK